MSTSNALEQHAAAALEHLRAAHVKLLAADGHLCCMDDVSDLVRLHAISTDLARLIGQLENRDG